MNLRCFVIFIVVVILTYFHLLIVTIRLEFHFRFEKFDKNASINNES